MERSLTTFLALAPALSVGGTAYAQIYTGTIAGRVSDQTGAVLPGVLITLTSEVLIQPQTATTSATGSYRFAELAIGTYITTFELSGFQKLIRENIILTAGATQTINVELGIAELEETITVSSESPVVDVRQTGIPESFTRERLEDIPSARDPWVILEATPGVLVDRQNVGGNESGQQSTFTVRGDNGDMVTYNYDGVNITDEASLSSPGYFDFGAFEEIQIQTGGNEASMQTGGAQINFLIKQGTNNWSGQGYFYGTDNALQWDNVSPELEEQGAGAGAPIKYIVDYGFDVGGPILKDKAWIWGDYNIQDIHKGAVGFLVPGCDDPDDISCLNDDPTKLRNNNVKFNLQATSQNKFNFLWMRNEKTRATRGASDTRPLETTWKQGGPTNIYKLEDTHIVNDNFLLTGRFAYVSGGFFLAYQEPDLRTTQPGLDINTFSYSRSYLDYTTERPQYIFNLDSNYFLSDALGGDHEWKFGFQYKKADITSATTYGGDVFAVFDGAVAGANSTEAWLYRPGNIDYGGSFTSFHVQDVYTRERMTLKLGVRFDHQKGQNNPSLIPASLVVPNFMPAVDFPGTPPITWNNLSPRLGFTYDLTGDGRNIIRTSYSRYYNKLTLGGVVNTNNTANVSEADVPWTDLNGDTFVQANEVDTSTIFYLYNFDPDNPGSTESPIQVDPDISAPTVDEFILGAEREVMPNFAVGGTFIWKKFDNLLWDDWWPDGGVSGIDLPYIGVTSADFVQTSEMFEGQPVTYYELPFDRPAGEILTNWQDYHQTYKGIEFFGKKRFSQGWMMTVGYSWNDMREYFESDKAIFDPTNIDFRNGGQVYAPTGGSGKTRYFMNSRHVFRFDGMVQLPGEVVLAGKFQARQGFTLPATFRTANRGGGIGRAEVLFNEIGDDRLPNLYYADFRVEKRFNFSGAELSGMLDIFNLFNANTTLKRESRQNFSNANRVQDIISGRIIRFGVRVRF